MFEGDGRPGGDPDDDDIDKELRREIKAVKEPGHVKQKPSLANREGGGNSQNSFPALMKSIRFTFAIPLRF